MAERGEFGPPGFGPSEGEGEPSISIEEFIDQHLQGWNLHPNLNDQNFSLSYSGHPGWGYATIDEEGIGWNFTPSDIPSINIQGQNFNPTGMSYDVITDVPGLDLNLNLDQDFDPSLDFGYFGVPNTGLIGSYGINTGTHNLQGTMNDLFGVPGLNLDAHYGTGGWGAGISYGGDLRGR